MILGFSNLSDISSLPHVRFSEICQWFSDFQISVIYPYYLTVYGQNWVLADLLLNIREKPYIELKIGFQRDISMILLSIFIYLKRIQLSPSLHYMVVSVTMSRIGQSEKQLCSLMTHLWQHKTMFQEPLAVHWRVHFSERKENEAHYDSMMTKKNNVSRTFTSSFSLLPHKSAKSPNSPKSPPQTSLSYHPKLSNCINLREQGSFFLFIS